MELAGEYWQQDFSGLCPLQSPFSCGLRVGEAAPLLEEGEKAVVSEGDPGLHSDLEDCAT